MDKKVPAKAIELGSVLVEFTFALVMVMQMVLAAADMARLGYTKSVLRYHLTKALREAQASKDLYATPWKHDKSSPEIVDSKIKREQILNKAYTDALRYLPSGLKIKQVFHKSIDVSGDVTVDKKTPFSMLLPGAVAAVEGSQELATNPFKCVSTIAGEECSNDRDIDTVRDTIDDLSNKFPLSLESYVEFHPLNPLFQNFELKVSVSGFRFMKDEFTMPELEDPNPELPPTEQCIPNEGSVRKVCTPYERLVGAYNELDDVLNGTYPAIGDEEVNSSEIFINDLVRNTTLFHPILGTNGWNFEGPAENRLVCGEFDSEADDPEKLYDCQNINSQCNVFCVRKSVGCFTGETLIDTKRGKVRVRDLTRADIIINPINGTSSKISNLIRGPEEKPVIEIISGDVNSIVVTDDHPMLTTTGIVAAADIKVGDLLVMADGIESSVTELRIFNLPEDDFVYNIELDVLLESETVDRLLSANGFATGDLFVQNSLKN